MGSGGSTQFYQLTPAEEQDFAALSEEERQKISAAVSRLEAERDQASGCQSIINAAGAGSLPIVQRFLQQDPAAVESADERGRTALHVAALNCHANVVKDLLAARAVQAVDCHGDTPLHHAALSSSLEVVQQLLGARADVEARNNNGRTALDFAQMKGCEEVMSLLSSASPQASLEDIQTLHFTLKERPAILNAHNVHKDPSYLGRILENAKVCWVSFPGKYLTGWIALISERHWDSVACVFLDDPDHGLGRHHFLDDNKTECYCALIYGQKDYKEFGYLMVVEGNKTEEEKNLLRKRARAMNAHIVFGKPTVEDERKARELWEKHGKRAAWGCCWFHIWIQRVEEAVKRGQRLRVVFFPGEAGMGKVHWKKLPTSNLWDGNGLGGSQKAEVAYLDKMRRENPAFDYDEVDVTRFLSSQFQVGDYVDALDPHGKSNSYSMAKILQTPNPTETDDTEMKWLVESKDTGITFHAKCVRHAAHALEELHQFLGTDFLKKIFEDALKMNAKSIKAARLPSGKPSLAVQTDVTTIQSAQDLRDRVLRYDLDILLNRTLAERCQGDVELAVDQTVFFDQYAKSLLTLSELTNHQKQKLDELLNHDGGLQDIHLSAPAGSGKTFLAVHYLLTKIKLDDQRQVLYIAPSRPLILHFIRWVIMNAASQLPSTSPEDLLKRFAFMHRPYEWHMTASLQGSRIVLKEMRAQPKDAFLLAIFDEAHEMFKWNSELFEKVNAVQKMLLSDISQSSFLHHKFPHMFQSSLSEIVRSTKRIMHGASAFRLHKNDLISCIGTTGPPLKTFLFEMSSGNKDEEYQAYAKQTLDALWHTMKTYPSLRGNHIALLVPDRRFREEFKHHLSRHLEAEFAPSRTFSLVSFEDTLEFIPTAFQGDCGEDTLILDWDENAKGLEHLVVLCIGLDAEIDSTTDNLTRSRLYHAITRAQLQVLVVNSLLHGGWLEFLATLKLKSEIFEDSGAQSEIRMDAASRVVELAGRTEHGPQVEGPHKVSTGISTPITADKDDSAMSSAAVKEGADAASRRDAAQEQTVEVRDTIVWDTNSNTISSPIRKLQFDPRTAEQAAQSVINATFDVEHGRRHMWEFSGPDDQVAEVPNFTSGTRLLVSKETATTGVLSWLLQSLPGSSELIVGVIPADQAEDDTYLLRRCDWGVASRVTGLTSGGVQKRAELKQKYIEIVADLDGQTLKVKAGNDQTSLVEVESRTIPFQGSVKLAVTGWSNVKVRLVPPTA